MIKVPRDKKEGLWMLCLQPTCDREEDTGCISVGRRGIYAAIEFPRQAIWPHANS